MNGEIRILRHDDRTDSASVTVGSRRQAPTQSRGRQHAPPRAPGPRTGAPERGGAEHRQENATTRSGAQDDHAGVLRTQEPRRCPRAPGKASPAGSPLASLPPQGVPKRL